MRRILWKTGSGDEGTTEGRFIRRSHAAADPDHAPDHRHIVGPDIGIAPVRRIVGGDGEQPRYRVRRHALHLQPAVDADDIEAVLLARPVLGAIDQRVIARAQRRLHRVAVDLARRAAHAFAPPEALDALDRSIEAPALVALFARIGEAMGEERLVGDGAQSFALGPEEIRDEIARIEGQMTDPKSPLMYRGHPEHDALPRRPDALYRAAFPT